ncbi:uncharacterized protein RB166_016077 [Leptodactylus fuscus]
MDNHQLRDIILNFSLDGGPHGNQGYSRVLLQLFGYTGHGKSAFINSCKYAMGEGRFIEHADVGVKDGVMTMVRNSYELTQNISIVDNRGYQKMNSFQRAEIYAQLGNFIPIGEEVEWMENYSHMMNRLEDAESNPNYSDFIVPILIHSATHLLQDHEMQDLKQFMENCVTMTGIKPIVVITKKNSGVFNDIRKVFELIGGKVIIFIKNYTKEDHDKTEGKTEDLLKIIHNALTYVTLLLKKERDPQGDWRERKKFLLDYIYKAGLEEEKQRWIKEEKGKKRRVVEESGSFFQKFLIQIFNIQQ